MEVLQNCKIVNLDIEISLLSARLSNIHKLSFVDSTIYATAQFYKAQLITFDKHFKDLDNVIYFQK
jgi:predicted nucleic acid-binding protein